jgi:hypothetical protein
MALNRYVVTSDTTVPAGTATPVSGGAGNTVSWSGPGPYPVTYARGQAVVLDPAGALFAAIGAPNLRAWADGTDAAGRPGISN